MSWFKTRSTPLPSKTPATEPREILALPPGAFPLRKIESLLDDEQSLIARIRLNSGVSNETFEKLYTPLLIGYGDFIQMLPASRAKHHFTPGGMWRFSLEIALLSLQTADSKIFSGAEPVELRHLIEPRWRFASFCAGLLLDVGIVLSQMRVLSPDGTPWEPLLSSLHSWASKVGADHYYVQWLPEDEMLQDRQYRMFSGVLANRLLPSEILSYLYQGSTSILHELVLALSGLSSAHSQNTLLLIVDQSRNSSIERDIKSRAGFSPSGTIGLPVETYLLDAIRSLSRSHWKLNTPGSLLWLTPRGLFIRWEEAVPHILKHLEREGLHSMPKMSNTLAEILLQHKMAIPPKYGKTHDIYWSIDVPGVGAAAALLFSSPELILSNRNQEPVDIRVLSPIQTILEARTAAIPSGQTVSVASTLDQPANTDKTEAITFISTTPAVGEQEDQTPYVNGNKAMPGASKTNRNERGKTNHENPEQNGARQKSPEESLIWLRKQGKSGEILAALAEDCKSGHKRSGIDVFWVDNGLAVIFPNALMGNGFDPAKALSAIRDKGWLVANQKMNKAVLHDIATSGGVVTKALILTPSIGSCVAAAAGITHPDTEGTRVASTSHDSVAPSPAATIKPKDFFDALSCAIKEGKIEFLVEIIGEGVRAAYPAVFEWYATQQHGVRFKEVAMQLTSKDYVITQRGRSVIRDEEGREYVVFKRDYCPRLYAVLDGRREGINP
ncbi:MAG: MobH family relaxase [Sulfuricaulis sp.]